jgi:hypothetical protein
MRRFGTSFARLLGTLATGTVLSISAALGASEVKSVESSIDLTSIASTWQVGDFPSVRMFTAFGSIVETALREESVSAGPLTFVENRSPAWLRPQPQPKALAGEVSGAPNRVFLDQNYPNPFNPSTVIRYGVPSAMKIKLTVHTLLGTQIRVLVDQWVEPGNYTFEFAAADLPSGAYFYRLQSDMGTITRRMIVSK